MIHRNRMYENNSASPLSSAQNSPAKFEPKVTLRNNISSLQYRSFSDMLPPISKTYNTEITVIEDDCEQSYV